MGSLYGFTVWITGRIILRIHCIDSLQGPLGFTVWIHCVDFTVAASTQLFYLAPTQLLLSFYMVSSQLLPIFHPTQLLPSFYLDSTQLLLNFYTQLLPSFYAASTRLLFSFYPAST